MKISGTDEINQLLLEIKVRDEGIDNSDTPKNLEKLTQKYEETFLRKDEFIRSGKTTNIKTEVQFTKNFSELPKAYLQRIATEVINQRESDKTNLNDSEHSNKSNKNEIVETAVRTGLVKYFMLSKIEYSNKSIVDLQNKWLLRVILVFLIVILIYSILKYSSN